MAAADLPSSQVDGVERSVNSKKLTRSGKPVGVYLLTWNVGWSPPPPDLNDVLSLNKQQFFDVYGIGLQEVKEGDNTEWVEAFTSTLKKHDFVRIKLRRLQGLITIMFVKRSHLSYCTSFESEATRTGLGGWWGNKGGVSIRMDLFGVNFIVVNSHLAAHLDNVRERIEDYGSIIDNQKFKDPDVETILDHDYVFWMGDLNFRLDKTTRLDAENAIERNDYAKLLLSDQLNMCREEELIFVNFKEGCITFPPTYKFDPGTNTYDTSSKQRVPAWCDRILWYSDDAEYGRSCRLQVKQLVYTSHPTYLCSDHKPVSATFEISVYPKPPLNPVRFEQIKEWQLGQSQIVRYQVKDVLGQVKTSSSDWIGLYKAKFVNFETYLTYVSAIEGAEKNAQGVEVTFSAKAFNDVPPGNYCLCYLTKKYSLMGISQVFPVRNIS
ncbi:hypothetical protein C0Q70_08434 [Pomacea canaliculata]|uniref:Inositol polyphosphate-related phosphatase domain-containing protein n=1 Tax=Pomacea canaliculata TaxID=400727 RepID=A0A2T7PHT6_POMCA|nr:hypothetical protein C0Q70_08434 [Pomacea canaliculata]